VNLNLDSVKSNAALMVVFQVNLALLICLQFLSPLVLLASTGIGCRRVSVCPSVTSQCSTETAKRRITRTMPHGGPGTLVFCYRKFQQISNGVTIIGGAKCSWG